MTRNSQRSTPREPDTEPRRVGRLRNLAFSGAMVVAAAAAGSVATEPSGEWYRRLDKPSWQPPGVAFPIVWTSLFAGIAATSTVALNELERRGDVEQAAQYRRALTTNLALNSLWSWLFFRWHYLGAAAVGAGVLAADSIQLARRAGRVRPQYGRLLAPYAVWTSFATVLATAVWWRNRDTKR